MEYQHIAPSCDLACTSLEEAARLIGPSFVYELYISPTMLLYGRDILRRISADRIDHPLAPHINLIEDSSLGRNEWVLRANGKAAGSPGVW